MTYCGDNCGFLGMFPSDECKAQVQCGCDVCSSFRAIDLNLFESCSLSCNSVDRKPSSKDAFLEKYDPKELFDRYKIIKKGWDPKDTDEFKMQKQAQDRTDGQQNYLGKILLFGFVIVAAVVGYFYLNK